MKNKLNRRNFLKISALGGVAATATACDTDPVEKLIPILVPAHDIVPGESVHYATTCRECSADCGMIIRTREGRAIKAEGNPAHPLSKGKICTLGQSTLQGLYNPSRAKSPVYITDGVSKAIRWTDGITLLNSKLTPFLTLPKNRNRILYFSPPKSGSFPQLLTSWMNQLGGGTQIELDLMSVNSIKKANDLCFGSDELPHFALEKAEILINFGADFLETWINPIQMTAAYSAMHSPKNGIKGEFIHIAPHMSLTGSNADEWISCPTGTEAHIALAICDTLLRQSTPKTIPKAQSIRKFLDRFSLDQTIKSIGLTSDKIDTLAKKFKRNGKSLAIGGGNSSAGKNASLLQIAVNLLNYIAGNIGTTVIFGMNYKIGGDDLKKIEVAVGKMKNGEVDLVIIENINPAFTLPKSLGFEAALDKVPFVVSLSTETDETSLLADLHLPTSHFLESWDDTNPRTGLYTLQQPVMSFVPGYDTMGSGDLILASGRALKLKGFLAPSYQEHLKTAWQQIQKTVGKRKPFNTFWIESLKNGYVNQEVKPKSVSLQNALFSTKPSPPEFDSETITLLALNSNLHNANAKGGNRNWLLETPHPITQVVWDAWLELHPKTAQKLGIQQGELVDIKTNHGSIQLGAWLYHGIAENTIAVPVGMGRSVYFPSYSTSRGRNKLIPILEPKGSTRAKAKKVGENLAELLPWELDTLSGDLCFTTKVISITGTGKQADLVTMDGQYRKDIKTDNSTLEKGLADRSQKGRGFIQSLSLNNQNGQIIDEAPKSHQLRKRHYTLPRDDKHSFYDPMKKNVSDHVAMTDKTTPTYHDPYKWEMAIDLDRCIGCTACVVACYAENNIPSVGKNRAALGREMSWLRISRYFEKNKQTGKLETYFSPQMCQQCDNAGCEPVCPVYATYQTPDGLNAMIYNRCVGTRYCANNCAFSQRRFNWRSYQFPSPLHLQLNPAVSVRAKGVMEKCTFCGHRIREMKDIAKDQGRDVRDQEIQTACQQACPADAIVFGNVMDKKSRIYKLKQKNKRGYTQLPELNYQPAVTYLKKVNHDNKKA
jgi:anaerobic selenocysteine-containing dehydrogenase/Fe-S-cluster-containing dehydrogenase component